MKKYIKKLTATLAICTFFCTSLVVFANTKDFKSYSNIELSFNSDVLATRGKSSFKGYSGKGSLNINMNNATSADIYINEKKLDISKIIKDKKGTVSIADYTINGFNNLKVINIEPTGAEINIKYIAPKITFSTPEQVNISTEKLTIVDKFINDEVKGINPITGKNMIDEGIVTSEFPGAVVSVVKNGEIIKNSSYGYKNLWNQYEKITSPEKTTVDTLYDMASNTKMYATNYALMKLVYEGKLNLDDKVQKYFPEYKDREDSSIKGKDKITIKNLLYHNAGHAPTIEFYDKNRAKDLYAITKKDTINSLSRVPLTYEVGSKVLYSDLDYMILGYLVEVITGNSLDVYVEENIYKPLGLTKTCFNPLKKGFKVEDIAATERNGNTRDGLINFDGVRTYTLQGEVHDEKAFYSMEGVSGHAGLFSTGEETAILCQILLNGGVYEDFILCDKETIDEFLKPSYTDTSWALGWNIQDGSRSRSWMFSPYTYNTVGHTGWTGTLTSIDFENDMIVVLLTNQRNTPCPNDKFECMKYETGRYGSIITLIYEALFENIKSDNNPFSETITKIENDNTSQIDPIFPDSDPSSRYHVRNKRGFYGFKGKGKIVVKSEDAIKGDLFINGNKIDISKALTTNEEIIIDIGNYTVDGVNSLKVLNIDPTDAKIFIKVSYPELTQNLSLTNEILTKNFNKIDEILNTDIKHSLKGATLGVISEGSLIKNSSYGVIKENDLFHLGNGTEIFSTVLAINKLISETKLNYDDFANKYVAGFDNSITIKHLLEHTSGLPEKIEINLSSLSRNNVLKNLSNIKPEFTPGTSSRYSEYDAYLLGMVIESVTNMQQDEYVEKFIFKPLGLVNTLYNPNSKGIPIENILKDNKKEYPAFNGVSGGMGLYSNVKDLAVLCQTIMNYGGYSNIELFNKDTSAHFISPTDKNATYGHGILRKGNNKNKEAIGAYGDSNTIGINSNTGITITMDMNNKNAIIYKTEISDNDKLLSANGGNIITLVTECLNNEQINWSSLLSIVKDYIYKINQTTNENYIKATTSLLSLLVNKSLVDEVNRDFISSLINTMPNCIEKIELQKHLGIYSKPGKISNLKGKDITNKNIKLTWENPSIGSGKLYEYIIYKDGKVINKVRNSEYVFEGLTPNTLYGFKVVAVDISGEKSRPVAINLRTSK